jgi:hypothetical protein
MKLLQIFWIHILGLVLFLLFDIYLFESLNIEVLSISYLLCFIFYWFAFLVLVRIAPNRWFQAEPTPNWYNAIQQKSTVVLLLGFGYNKSDSHIMLPGEANEKLYIWTVENTKSKLYLVQEGFWGIEYPGAKNRFYGRRGSMQERWELTKPFNLSGNKVLIKRIHPHKKNSYVDTPDAIIKAFELLLKKRIRKGIIILVAHPMQLWRVHADCELLKREKNAYRGFKLVFPKINNIPYPINPPLSQIHTKRSFYKIIEILLSRPKDYLKLKLKYRKNKRKLNPKRN